MIRNIADIIRGFMLEEKRKLNEFDIKHAPTIGDMYEGLTSFAINKIVFDGLDLKIVSGVIYDDNGQMSGQIDCMLVVGNGIEIPYTDKYKWHIKDIICVFEIKKTLYSNDLKDAFVHLREVNDLYVNYMSNNKSEERVDVGPSYKAFGLMTGKIAPSREGLKNFLPMEQFLYHSLIDEQLSPLRIVIGYNGFKTESRFRESLLGFLEENVGQKGFGVGSFPQLIISDQFSLIKANGHPYSPALDDGYWNFLVSSKENPVVFIIEFIWTKLQQKFELKDVFLGEELDQEEFHPFLKAKLHSSQRGWEYIYQPISEELLKEVHDEELWKPVFLDDFQHTIVSRLCMEGEISIDDQDMIDDLKKLGSDINVFIDGLINTRLVGMKDDKLELITDYCQCVILPDGRLIAGENVTGQLTTWIKKYLNEKG